MPVRKDVIMVLEQTTHREKQDSEALRAAQDLLQEIGTAG